jgi:lysozyme
MTIDGVIDLFHGDKVTDFSVMRKAGIVGVINKATQGSSFVDPTFTQRVTAERDAGLLVGAYHFCDASPIARQAANLLHAIKGSGPLIVALDAEPNGSSTTTIKQTAALMLSLAASFHKLPIIYVGRFGPDGNGTGFPDPVLRRCPLWVPSYGTNSAALNRVLAMVGLLPRLPAGWSSAWLWQFTDKAIVPGVRGPVDRSRFNGSGALLQATWAANSVSV